MNKYNIDVNLMKNLMSKYRKNETIYAVCYEGSSRDNGCYRYIKDYKGRNILKRMSRLNDLLKIFQHIFF